MPLRLLLTLVVALLASRACEHSAHALDVRKKYERELIQWALGKTGLTREPQPEGKIIERVVVVREDIIAKSDPWPSLLNVVHVKTKEYIIRQELLKRAGDRWEQARIYETERNLRRLFILAVARTVACKSKKPGHVILMVVTKDLWSIRFNIIFSMTGQLVKLIDFTPTEQNFLGRNKQVSLHARFQQFNFNGGVLRDHVALGQRYVDPRVWGTRLRLVETFDLVINGSVPCAGSIGATENVWCDRDTRSSGSVIGVEAGVSLSRPLFSLATPWAFAWSASVRTTPYRDLVQGSDGNVGFFHQAYLRDPTTGRIRSPLEGEDAAVLVPIAIERRIFRSELSFTRRFGHAIKHDISWGLSAYRVQYTLPDSLPFEQDVLDEHARLTLPRSESAVTFFVGYAIRTTRFVRLRNVTSFALSEDFSLGPSLDLVANFGQNVVSGRAAFITLSAEASYRWSFGGDLLTVSAIAQTRYQPHLDDEPGFSGPFVNNRIELGAKNITPKLLIGRLHTQIVWLYRREDLNRSFFSLGGDSGLRGYTNDLFRGRDLLRVNAEFRSDPINLFTLHLGFVVFYDGGATYGDWQPSNRDVPFAWRQSVGIGARGHFPQFDRESLRIDLGFPINADGRGSFGTWISLSFGQVF
ncbi:MAG: hypothetical protein KC503_25590 [Myxococcales bacterium]|nr:hypothetical protein [Myxococcales bacterium]